MPRVVARCAPRTYTTAADASQEVREQVRSSRMLSGKRIKKLLRIAGRTASLFHTMGHRYITVALILGMVSLPLSCGGDDDDTTSTGAKGGTSGGAGKGGNGGKAGATGGKAGKGGTGGTGGSTAGKGGTGGTGGSTAGKGGTSGTGGAAGTGNVGNTGGQSGDGAGGTVGSSGAGAGGEPAAGNGGNGGEGGAVDPVLQHRMETVTTICNKPVPNDPDPAGCGMVDTCIAYMMVSPFGDSTDCVTKYDALLDCRAGVAADQFLCGTYGVDTYPVDTDECMTESDAAFYCTP